MLSHSSPNPNPNPNPDPNPNPIVTLLTVAWQAPLPMGFSKQEY